MRHHYTNTLATRYCSNDIHTQSILLHTHTHTHTHLYIYIYSFHDIPVPVGQKGGTAVSAACKDILLSPIVLSVPKLRDFSNSFFDVSCFTV